MTFVIDDFKYDQNHNVMSDIIEFSNFKICNFVIDLQVKKIHKRNKHG